MSIWFIYKTTTGILINPTRISWIITMVLISALKKVTSLTPRFHIVCFTHTIFGKRSWPSLPCLSGVQGGRLDCRLYRWGGENLFCPFVELYNINYVYMYSWCPQLWKGYSHYPLKCAIMCHLCDRIHIIIFCCQSHPVSLGPEGEADRSPKS